MGGSQISLPPRAFNASDVKVRRTGMTVLGKIDESGPLSQPLPEASHDEAPSSGSLNVSMKSKGKNVDVSLCEESSSFSGPTKSRSDLISSILNDIAEVEGKDIAKVEDVDLDDLMKDMSELLKLSEKEIESFGTVPHILKDIRGPFRAVSLMSGPAIFGLLLIDHYLERYDAVFTNREKCWHLIKEMYYLASSYKKLRENPEGMQDVMQEATALILEGARVCCTLIGRSVSTSFYSTSLFEIKGVLKDFTERLNLMPIRITLQMGFRFLSDIERQGRSHLSKGYPTPAESGPFSQPLPGACHDEAPFSGSFNVSMKSKGKNVDVSFNVSGTTRCDEASSSGYSDLPKRSEGQDFNVNLNISGAPRCDEAPSSSSSSGPTKSRSDEIKYKVEDVNLDDLWKHIFELRKLREKGNHPEASILGYFPWPDVPGLQKLKEIVSFGTDLLKEDIHGPVKALLKEIVNVASAAPLVVAHTLERFDAISTNREKCWHLIKEMYYLAIVHKRLRESAEGMQDVMQEATSFEGMQDVMQEATSLIIEGALVCFTQTGRSAFTRFISTSTLEFEGALSNIRQKLKAMYMKINTEIALRGFTLIEHQGRSPLSKEYPTRADNGQVEEDLLSTGCQKVFKIEALVAATNNFHEDNKVGEGGFGAVYQGTTDDGKQIAVKKMSFTNERSREFMTKQFDNEKLLAEVQHRNLVNLLGYCEQGSERFLVYEYLPNESLDKFLSDPEKRKRLDWYKRYNIIEGIVCGLCYLHEYSQRRIVHRDIKTSNILLDETLSPKIADFGTAKLFPEDRTHVSATERVGTHGYMPPEYAMDGKITVKLDVYSFGVVLFELLTGKLILNKGTEYLEWVWSSYNQNKVADIIDRTITETWDKEKAKAKAKAKALALRCFQVALLCIQNDATLRPTMLEVKMKLSSSESLPVPTKPPLVSSRRRSCF